MSARFAWCYKVSGSFDACVSNIPDLTCVNAKNTRFDYSLGLVHELSIYLSIHLSICLSIYLSVCLSVCLSGALSL